VSGEPCLVRGSGPWCGTVGGYTNHGCRCDACGAAKHDDWDRYVSGTEQARRRHVDDLPDPRITAPVTCWCGRRTKRLPLDDIRAGRTFSCGIGCSRLTAAA
jgi:hypothetical protein